MTEKNFPYVYWAKALNIVVYIMSRISIATIHNVMLEEKYTGKKLDLSHMKVFGCIAYVHVLDELCTKLDPKAKKCVFIAYSLVKKGYKCYNTITRDVQVSKDVVFNEVARLYFYCKR